MLIQMTLKQNAPTAKGLVIADQQKKENSVPWLNSEVNVAEMFLVFMMFVAMEMDIFDKQIFDCCLIKKIILLYF